MIAMMVIASQRKVMGRFTERPLLMIFGWTATAVMAAASGITLIQMIAG
jgi:Mn2+/Fe2+ NRAMP family transporter